MLLIKAVFGLLIPLAMDCLFEGWNKQPGGVEVWPSGLRNVHNDQQGELAAWVVPGLTSGFLQPLHKVEPFERDAKIKEAKHHPRPAPDVILTSLRRGGANCGLVLRLRSLAQTVVHLTSWAKPISQMCYITACREGFFKKSTMHTQWKWESTYGYQTC